MANNTVMRKIVLTAEYAPLADAPLVASVCVSTMPENVANAHFLGDDGEDVPWVPGEWHEMRRVDLSRVKVKGAPGDVVTVVGGTW